jgi:hypothetical protein
VSKGKEDGNEGKKEDKQKRITPRKMEESKKAGKEKEGVTLLHYY